MSILQDQDKEYVGFATLPNQVHRKSVKKGFDFTLMVAGKTSFEHNLTCCSQSIAHHLLCSCSLTSEGESGLGKSTLVNSLFLTDLYKDRKLLNAEGTEAIFIFSVYHQSGVHLSWETSTSIFNHTNLKAKTMSISLLYPERITQTVEITKHTVDIEEKGVKLKLTIVDTPGFGDAVNNTEW